MKVASVLIRLVLISCFLGPLLATAETPGSQQTNLGATLPKISNPLNNPKLQVSIPGFGGFRNAVCDPQTPGSITPSAQPMYCTVPWLADYISGLYRYGIGIITILAVIIIMIAGIMWLTAGGNEIKISEAKKWISGGLLGVLIAASSYLFLNVINPVLTQLSPIKLSYVAYQPFESLSPEELKANLDANLPDRDRANEEPKRTAYNFTPQRSRSVFSSIFSLPIAYADNYFSPPVDTPLYRQCGESIRYTDYSKDCQCTEKKNTKNESCGKNYSTICTSGCGIVSLLMAVASYGYADFNEIYNIADFMEANDKYRICGSGTKVEGLIAYVTSRGGEAETVSKEYADQLLEAGYPIMMSLGPASGCTSFGHWVTVIQKHDGQYLIRNPEGSHKNCQGWQDELSGVNRYLFIHPPGRPRL